MMTHPRGHWWWPSRVTNVKNSVQPVTVIGSRGQPPRGDFSFSFFFNHGFDEHGRTLLSYPLFLYVQMSGSSGFPMSKPLVTIPVCIFSRTISNGFSIVALPSFVLNRDREFPRSGFRSHRMAKNQRRKKKKINKSRATLVLSMVIPKKDDAGQRCGHCPFGRVPFSHTSSTGWIFCLLYGRNWLSSLPPIIPLRALLSRNRISMDGQRPEPEGLDLRNFLKSDSGDAVGTCELGTELERVGKRFQSLTEDEGLGR